MISTIITFDKMVQSCTYTFNVKKLAKSEEEDIAGNYFKPKRANRLMAQAHKSKNTGQNYNIKSNLLSCLKNLTEKDPLFEKLNVFIKETKTFITFIWMAL